MDGIITIVIIAAAIIFKVVGKKFESPSGDEVFPHIPVDPDEFDVLDVGQRSTENDAQVSQSKPVVDEVVVEEAERALPAQPVRLDPVNVQKPILEEEQPKQKEKIDVKKLIVYSEIMKPKFDE